jgi:hypothetical protein
MPLADFKIPQSYIHNRKCDIRPDQKYLVCNLLVRQRLLCPAVRGASAAIFPSDKFILRSYARIGTHPRPLVHHDKRGRKTMRKIIIGLLGSALVGASMVSAATAAEHPARHERTYTSERAWDVIGWYNPHSASVADQSAFGTVSPWRSSGLRPDDWRQSVNGG